jgi:hypothetical protein
MPKPDTNVSKVSRNAMTDLQLHSLITSYWFKGHADKCGRPLSPQEELNIITDGLAGKAENSLPTDMKPMKPRNDCLHFPEQQISIVIQQRKFTSCLPYHISNAIHGPKFMKYLSEK